MNTSFSTESIHELNALHRVIIEAKFSEYPNDRDISASPLVCEMYRRIFEELKTDGKDWDAWLEGQRDRFQRIVTQNVGRIQDWEWNKWSDDQKFRFIEDSLFPLTVGDAEIFEMVRIGNETHES